MSNLSTLINGLYTMSNEIGILYHVVKLPRLNNDPKQVNYGIWPSNTLYLSGEKYGGRSAGCGDNWEEAMLGTIGETLERYAPAFYNLKDSIFSSFENLNKSAVSPKEFALFHEKQYEDERFKIEKFTEDIELTWFSTTDLTNGRETLLPGQFIYLPFNHDKHFVTANTSTGLAAHTNYYKAILTALYEAIERDSFVITWMQEIVSEKIIIDTEIQTFLDTKFPTKYEWHFFDITYDIDVPTVLGFCIGEAEYGRFIAVGSSSRQTFGEATKKVIQEIGQGIPYFRYLLGEKKNWIPDDDFSKIHSFEEHSIYYTKRPDLWHVFDKWLTAKPSKSIDFNESFKRNEKEEIRHIIKILKDKNYNVLFKDITTPDIRQLGFYSIKVFIPQLLQLAGAYPFYFLGGNRLFEVTKQMGYYSRDYDNLNKYPHPFP
ncbi:TPA: YcaO-like family protein [Elizabethkingia anophelis]